MSGKVQILMSTYNGEAYLKEQMDSLLGQTYPEIEILVRDDGSSDGTLGILKEYEEKYNNVYLYPEKNVGVTESFLSLLARSNGEYVAFCDQDDIWLSEKIEKAVEKLALVKGPALYCGHKLLVDAQGNPLAGSNEITNQPPRVSFENAVVESVCTGCTMVLNQPLVESLKNHMPKHAVIHDWWIYLVASYEGQVIYDEKAYICYRQHANNVIGQKQGFIGTCKAKMKYLKKSRGKLKAQLMEFQELYQGQDEKDALVKLLLESEKTAGKIKAVCSKKYYRQSKLDDFITRVLLLVNRML